PLLQCQTVTAPARLAPGLIESTIVLLAHFSLLSAISFNARHVLLDARGRLKVHIDPDRRNKSRRAKLKVVSSSKPRPAVAVQNSTVTEQPKFSSPTSASNSSTKPGASITKSTVTSPPDSDDEDDDSDDDAYAGLSRSERR